MSYCIISPPNLQKRLHEGKQISKRTRQNYIKESLIVYDSPQNQNPKTTKTQQSYENKREELYSKA